MKFVVRLAAEAEEDLVHVYVQIARAESVARADLVLDRLDQAIRDLDRLPRRGHVPEELARVAIREFRQTIVRPYRIIYEIVGKQVYVHAVLDGRRDLQDLLAERLLR